jgi:uncharacterized spore protein YtfJ
MDAADLLTKLSDNLSVRRAFGTAYEKDGVLVIPVALVAGGGGGGTARPRHGDPAADPLYEGGPMAPGAPPPHPEPADAGGGFGGLVWPAGAYVMNGDQVRWVPAVDPTIIVLASLTLVQILARTWTRSRRRQAGP